MAWLVLIWHRGGMLVEGQKKLGGMYSTLAAVVRLEILSACP
jgi:hypothetical protein